MSDRMHRGGGATEHAHAYAPRRPILQTRSLASIYEERSDCYRAEAHTITDTDGKPVGQVVEEVDSQWNR